MAEPGPDADEASPVASRGPSQPVSARGGRKRVRRWFAVAFVLVAVAVIGSLRQAPPTWPRRLVLSRGQGAVLAFEYAPDGRRVAVHLQHAGLFLLDPITAEPEARFDAGAEGGLLAFSPDGRLLASAGPYSQSITVWDLTTRRAIAHLEVPSTAALCDIRFTVKGALLRSVAATSSDGLLVTSWATNNWQRTHAFYVPDPGRTEALFSPDAATLVAGTTGGEVTIWDAQTGALLGKFLGLDAWVRSAAFTADGKMLAVGQYPQGSRNELDGPGTVWLLDVPTCRLRARLKAHAWGLVFSPDGRRLVASGTTSRYTGLQRLPTALRGALRTYLGFDVKSDAEATVWDLSRQRPEAVLIDPHAAFLRLGFSPDGRTLATRQSDERLVFWASPAP